jgi:subtilase family serine protease
MSWLRTDLIQQTTPSGYGPASLQAAYNLAASSSANGVGKTIAIVDAFDDPKAEADLGVYRTMFALPPCTTANGCFLKVNQSGMTSPLPATDPSPGSTNWAAEISLDLDMASAICPNCGIVLVEADNDSGNGLYISENTAASMCGASVISNSWSSGEYSSEGSDDVTYFRHPGVPMTFASGDSDYPGGYPAAGAYVTAVGGTTLKNAGQAGQTEKVWNNGAADGTGSVCSFYIPQPAWQTTALGSSYTSVCNMRINNDVAAVGDPNTGVAVYDTYKLGGWVVYGGTSVATPIIAGVYALSPNSGSINDARSLYAHASSFNDVVSGNDGPCTPTPPYTVDYTGTFVCDAGPGFDGPTGNGTPNGIGGF